MHCNVNDNEAPQFNNNQHGFDASSATGVAMLPDGGSRTQGEWTAPWTRGAAEVSDFGAQVSAVIPRLRRYARALTGDTLAADDLVQDTLERALSKRHLWRQGSDLRAWTFTIMHNVFVNQRRARSAEAMLTLDEEANRVAARVSTVDMLEVGEIDGAIRQLPVEQREVLLLIALEQMSYEETAQALGIPIGTVMSRLYRARERVRMQLNGEAAPGTLKVVK